jgi:O-6-methylguanine DNA methyltransferase
VITKHQPIKSAAVDEAQFRSAFEQAITTLDVSTDATPVSLDWLASPVGPLLVGATSAAIVMLEFSSPDEIAPQLHRLRNQLNRPLVYEATPLLNRLRSQLAEYFSGTRQAFDLPLEYQGSEFQNRVWTALRSIPFGETRSYGAIAAMLGDPGAMRAVGGANGVNPIAIVIPCHRVVNANGTLGGFGGGAWRKQVLLDLERGQGRLF